MKKYTLSLLAIMIACITHAQSWNLTGNTGTDPNLHFIGTTDFTSLKFRTANFHSGEIDPNQGIVSLGYGAGQGHVPSNYMSTAIGYKSCYVSLGVANDAFGAFSLYSVSTGQYNTGIGGSSLSWNTSGSNNTAVGYSSLLENITGWYNVAGGDHALKWMQTGSANTGIGAYSLGTTVSSSYNTALGANAGKFYDLGWNNTILGANSGGSFNGQYNIIAIGQAVVCPDNSTARIGNSATWSIGGFAGWSNFSDGRFKKNVKENVKGLDFIMKLRPVTYNLDVSNLSKSLKEDHGEELNDQMKAAIEDKEKMVMTGFVAQEVEQAAKETQFDFSGVDKPRRSDGYYALRYADFVVPLVKAMQEQQEMIRQLQAKVETLEKQADVAILLQSSNNEKISAYPNPANSYMTINVQTQHAGKGTLQIYESSGRLVKQMNIEFQAGVNTVNLSFPEMPAGVYNIKLNWGKAMQKQVSFVKSN